MSVVYFAQQQGELELFKEHMHQCFSKADDAKNFIQNAMRLWGWEIHIAEWLYPKDLLNSPEIIKRLSKGGKHE